MLLVRGSLGQTEVDLNDLCSDTEDYVGITVELNGRPVIFVSADVRPQGHWDPTSIGDVCTQIKARPEMDSWGSDHLPIVIGKPPKAPLKTCHLVDWKEYRGQLDKLVASGAPLDPEYVAETLKSHKNVTGRDGVTNQAIKNLDESCHDSLLDYVKKVWSSAEIPRAYKEATTVPCSCLEGRPMNLTTTMAEAKERGWSTVTVCLDMRKAFDALSYDTTFTALQNLGITGPHCFSPSRLRLSLRLPELEAVYADDVALWDTSPPNRREEMVRELQRALTNTVHRLHELGLGISAEKTTALFQAPILPTADAVSQKMRTRINTLRALGGTTMLAMYKGLVVSSPTYALPLVTHNSTQQQKKKNTIERAQRLALRICLGTPRTASSHKTLVEAGVATICATLQKRALGHLIRMEDGRSTCTLIMKIVQRTESGLGRALYQLGGIAGTAAAQANLPQLQERPQPLDVALHIAGLRSRRTAKIVTLRTLPLSHIEDLYHGWGQVFTNGSVRPTDGSSFALAAFHAAGVGLSERLRHHATSTTTELAAIMLVLHTSTTTSCFRRRTTLLCLRNGIV
ncbi:hypothetical protein HPB47_028436 [Ixodes persulcatus]|uniref:Uncharacterized protein n=1 Tax=Ixodes persulcatus TaxID=34615 RepID=A0AC60PUZ7_IXOPE|nr:hypothetical protein HPB47_028436 [Ixodes persulcatus]